MSLTFAYSNVLYVGLGIGIVAIGVWILAGYIAIRNIETPSYTLVEEYDGFEVRQYDFYIVAQTTVSGTYSEALQEGFSIVADYIFGNNTSATNISMTAPVVAEPAVTSEKIAMTAPVLADENESGTWTISFVMPSEYTRETLPVPTSDRVEIRTVPERTVAVLTFSWLATDGRVKSKKAELLRLLREQNIEAVGTPAYAGYNPPLTIPFMRTHEIVQEIK